MIHGGKVNLVAWAEEGESEREGETVTTSHNGGTRRDTCTHIDSCAWFVWEKNDRTSKTSRHEEISSA